MPSLSPPAELLSALSRALASLGVGWYVFGAQAALYWGRPRFTEDIDVTIHLGSISTSRLVDALRQDRDSVRETLSMLEGALGVSDLLPVFEQLLREGGSA